MKKRYAFVTFVMIGDGFVPGALVLGYQLKKQLVEGDLICLVTPDVSNEARNSLENIYDDVVEVPYIHIAHKDHTGRKDRPYLFTRFQALRLGRDGDLGFDYDKIVLLDADIMPLSNYQALFEVKAPAGIINEYKHHCIGEQAYAHMNGQWIWHRVYDDICPHGSQISTNITNRVWDDPVNMGVNACIWVLEPSMDDYNQIMTGLQQERVQEKIQQFKWPEMQFATWFWSGRWHNIDLRYAGFNGLPQLDCLYGTHFAGLKPWRIKQPKALKHYYRFDDYRLWYKTFYQLVKWTYPQLMTFGKNRQLIRFIERELKLYQDI